MDTYVYTNFKTEAICDKCGALLLLVGVHIENRGVEPHNIRFINYEYKEEVQKYLDDSRYRYYTDHAWLNRTEDAHKLYLFTLITTYSPEMLLSVQKVLEEFSSKASNSISQCEHKHLVATHLE